MNLDSINKTTDDAIAALLAGTMKPQTASAIAGLIRQNISAHKLAMEYAKAIGKTPSIPALDAPKSTEGGK